MEQLVKRRLIETGSTNIDDEGHDLDIVLCGEIKDSPIDRAPQISMLVRLVRLGPHDID
jgi:hypothetical protein